MASPFTVPPYEGGLPPQPSAPPALGGGTTTVTAVRQPSIVAAPMAGRVIAAPKRTDVTDAGFQLGGLATRPAQFEAAPTPAAAAQMAPPPPVFQPREYVPGLYMPQDRGGYSEAQGAAFADQARQGSWHESQRQMEAARAANDRQRAYDRQASTPRMAETVQARRQALQAFQRNNPPNVGSQSEMARPQPTLASSQPAQQKRSLFGNGSGKATQRPTSADKQKAIGSLGGAASVFGGK